MEILYVVGMIAVFVLCLVLFSTARRILRSSSLSSAQFGASRMYDVEPLDNETPEEIGSSELAMPGLKAIYKRSNASKNDFALMDNFAVMEVPIAESLLAESPMAETAMIEAAMIEAAMAEPVVPERISPETIMAEPVWPTTMIEDEPIMAAYVPPAIPSWAEKLADEDESEQPRTNRWEQFHKPSRRKYNYALECLLLGVSAWVLFQTQRSTLRYRLSQASSDRVA